MFIVESISIHSTSLDVFGLNMIFNESFWRNTDRDAIIYDVRKPHDDFTLDSLDWNAKGEADRQIRGGKSSLPKLRI